MNIFAIFATPKDKEHNNGLNEVFISENPHTKDDCIKWLESKGFHHIRIIEQPLTKPNFTNTINL
jgi:hypothetical protein